MKKYSGFEKELSEVEYRELWKVFSFEHEAKEIHKIVEEKGKDKDIIFIYHSFGTFMALTYFNLYPTTKVKGIIELGAAPIRINSVLKESINLVR